MEIRSASAFTVDAPAGPVAVAVCEVAPRFGALPDIEALRPDVRRAYDDPLPVAAQLAERERTYAEDTPPPVAPPRVLWVNEASDVFSVVEVRAHNVLGLLYRLTRTLADAGLDVRSARLHTLGAEIVDTFYLLGPDGGLLDGAEQRAALEVALLAACQPSD